MTMVATGLGTAALVGGGLSLLGGIFGGISSNSRAKKAAREKRRIEKEIKTIEENRQEIINPWASSENLSYLATDLSYLATSTVETVSNSFNNLGVATQASEFQAEQADISLANTLDTLRATGASAGGATALAQAALQSKIGISASLEAQEAQVQKLRAQGQQETDKFNAQAQMTDAQRIQSIQLNDAQRIQNVQLSEGKRIQETDATGAQFMFNTQENRTSARLDRLSGQSTNYANQEMAARQDQTAAITGAISSVGEIAGSYMSNQVALEEIKKR